MIMKARYLIYLLSGLMTFYSCVDDKGSYDYLQTPTVKITFSESIYDGVIGEETHIEPICLLAREMMSLIMNLNGS